MRTLQTCRSLVFVAPLSLFALAGCPASTRAATTGTATGGASTGTAPFSGIPEAVVFMLPIASDAGTPLSPGPGTVYEIAVMNLDGTGVRQLTNDGVFKFLPHFSPDGTKLVYTKYEVGAYGDPNGKADIAVLDLATETERVITQGGANVQGSWSPDGQRIAYLAGTTLADGVEAIWTVAPDGSNPQRIGMATGAADDLTWGDLAWSPADDWILFTAAQNIAGCFKVRTDKILSDGGSRTQVTNGGPNCTPLGFEQAGDADPGWSHDGTTIYSSRGLPVAPAGAGTGATERKLYSFSSDAWTAGKVENDLSLTSQPDCIEGVPKGSPDGTRVLLFRACFDGGRPNPQIGIFVTDTAGSYRQYVGPGFGADWNPHVVATGGGAGTGTSGGGSSGGGGAGTTGGGSGSACAPMPAATVISHTGATPSVAGEPVNSTDAGPTFGIYDPSLVEPADSSGGVLAYSTTSNNNVHTRVAVTLDRGQTFTFVAEPNQVSPTTITTTDASVCGSESCDAVLWHEVPSILADPGDPDSSRAYKIFTHSYASLDGGSVLRRDWGYIGLTTAAAPNGAWSAETPLLGWASSASLSTTGVAQVLTQIPELSDCVAFTEPGAVLSPLGIDLALSCVALTNGAAQYRIVLLRSTDHAASFAYVATLLTPSDAYCLGSPYSGVIGPDLFYVDGGEYLSVSPLTSVGYDGCVILPMADATQGIVARTGAGAPQAVRWLSSDDGQFTGPCTYAEGATASGYLVPMQFPSTSTPFRIFATGIGGP